MKEMIERKKGFPWGSLILSALAFLCAGVLVQRYVFGLGAMTNMSDGRGWGLWISFDLYCGVALAAGGFTLAAIVHIFNMEKYHPVVRPAILTAFLGYLLVVLALLVDLGQPWYIWRMIFLPVKQVDPPCQSEPSGGQGHAAVQVKAYPEPPGTAIAQVTDGTKPVDITNDHRDETKYHYQGQDRYANRKCAFLLHHFVTSVFSLSLSSAWLSLCRRLVSQ